MEFLMTYGWAILVVLAAIGALAYFGVLSPDRFLPSKCVINPPLSCTEYKVSAGDSTTASITVGILNNAGVSLSEVNITLSSPDCPSPTAQTGSGSSGATIVEYSVDNGRKVNGTNAIWTCGSALQAGDKFQGDFDIVYIKSGETVSHTTTGSIQAKVEN